MLGSFGILVLRRLMTQKRKSEWRTESGLTITAAIVRVSQKRMTYDTLFVWFSLFQKGAFLIRRKLLFRPYVQ